MAVASFRDGDLGGKIHLCVGLARQRDQAVRPLSVLGEPPRQVGLKLFAPEAAVLHDHLALGFFQGPGRMSSRSGVSGSVRVVLV